IAETLPEARRIVQVRETPCELRVGARWESSIALGVEPAFLPVTNMAVALGRWLTAIDLDNTRNVAVLGAQTAENLFPLENPIGKLVRVNSDRYSVVGVLEHLGRASGSVGPPLDQCVFVPLTTSRARFGDVTTIRSGGSFSRERVE